MNNYKVQFSEKAIKSMKRLDKYQARIIYAWALKNLDGCSNPRALGKSLVGDKKGYWRYRVGSYRIIAEIDDTIITINIVNVDHRKDIYEK